MMIPITSSRRSGNGLFSLGLDVDEEAVCVVELMKREGGDTNRNAVWQPHQTRGVL